MIFPNKDTNVCISISRSPGNFGCFFHNTGYKKLNLNYIYKSFYVNSSREAMSAVRTLGLRGCSVTMPFKTDVLRYVDVVSDEVDKINAANTIVYDGKILKAHNTDAYSSYTILKEPKYSSFSRIYILGNGGYSKAVEYSAKKLNYTVDKITRKNWETIFDLSDSLIYNCTPVKGLEEIFKEKNNVFIDCCTKTETGSKLAFLQGTKQFHLYTGDEYPFDHQTFLELKEVEKNV